jgi:hypothetical protein
MGVVIPVCTFVLGYGLSSWEKYSDKQDKLRNIEYILLTELGQNLGHLASIQQPQGRTEPLPPDLVSLIAQKLSFDVFKAYLGQIAELPRDEARSVFTAYVSLQHLTEEAKQFMAIGPRPPADSSLWAARATSVITQSEGAYERVLAAVKSFPDGPNTAEEALKRHGETIRNYDHFFKKLNKN